MSREIKELTEDEVLEAVKSYYRLPDDAWLDFECRPCHGGAYIKKITVLAPVEE